jgi:hypothetical protein
MTTTESEQSLLKKSHTKSEDCDPTPTLDLLNALTAAQEIADDPSGRGVRKLAKQIIEDCHGTDLQLVRDCAEVIRETSSRDERGKAADRIIELIEEILSSRTAALSTQSDAA